mmetsp:Transcript_64071/g.111684  ORF Transcript_64071/g.111684 Transcript_64071/m.111684 type:complete len:213 (-) Transcript_64071:178-816(-)
MRVDAALEDHISVVQEVVSRDGGSNIWPPVHDKLSTICRGDVFANHSQAWEWVQQCRHGLGVEGALSLEDINLLIRGLPMNKQKQTTLFHCCKCWLDALVVRDTKIRICCGTSGIELQCVDVTRSLGLFDLLGRCPVRQVEGHQRHEGIRGHISRDPCKNSFSIGESCFSGDHRWNEIRHHQHPAKSPRSVGHRVLKRRLISKMMVVIIRLQ